MQKIKSIKTLVICAFFVALSIIFGKFLNIPIGETIRFSFENTPLFLAGIMFGPIVSGIVAFVSDILGSILRGYAINPVITLGAIFVSVTGAFLFKILRKLPLFLRLYLSVIIAHILGSILIKTVGLSFYTGTSFMILLPMRCINYAIMIVIDTFTLFFLLKNRSLKKILELNL